MITGFAEAPGQGINGADFECPHTLVPGACAFNSTLDAASLCIDFPRCRALVYLANGGCTWV